MREVQPVWFGVLALSGAYAKDRGALGHVGEDKHRLGDEDGVAADRLGHYYPSAKPARPRGEVAKERLVVENVVGSGALGGEPAKFLVPDGGGKERLEVVLDHHRIELY
jgi:hypothetical protein